MNTNYDKLRHVRLEPTIEEHYFLETWDTLTCNADHKSRIAYRFSGPDGIIFEGEDFFCSPMAAVDSDECLRSLLGFLTLSKGDVDTEYFDGYTPKQVEFSESRACEFLQMWALDNSDLPFEEINDEL